MEASIVKRLIPLRNHRIGSIASLCSLFSNFHRFLGASNVIYKPARLYYLAPMLSWIRYLLLALLPFSLVTANADLNGKVAVVTGGGKGIGRGIAGA